jgi:hypothetical protein
MVWKSCWATLALMLTRFPAGAHYGSVMSMGCRPPTSDGKRCATMGRSRAKVGGSVGGLQVTVQPLQEAT